MFKCLFKKKSMTIFVELRDHEHKLHQEFEWIVTGRGKISQLRDKIKLVFSIDHVFQELFYNGSIIRSDTVNEVGIKDKGRFIVKHSLLENWIRFVSWLETAQDAMASNMPVRSGLDPPSGHLKRLIESNFFVTYPCWDETRQTFQDQFSCYLNTESEYIEIASKYYFSIIYGENPACPTLDTKCVQKRRGILRCLECHIYQNEKLKNIYHVKIHIRLAKVHDNESCDLRELFVYKLLEFINIGPKVHFVPNIHHSGFGLFIASEDIPGFRHDSVLDEKDPTRMAQLQLLSSCLFLRHLKNNYGTNNQGQLKIVDFKIGNLCKRSELVARKYFSQDTQFRIDVGKSSFPSWDLLKNIDAANNAIEDQKKLLDKHSIAFKSDRMLDDYLTNIKDNVDAIASYFE